MINFIINIIICNIIFFHLRTFVKLWELVDLRAFRRLSFVQWDFLQVTSDLLLLIVMFYCYIIKFAEYVDQKSKTRSDRDEKSGKHGKQACTIFSVT